jgi:hypothetical protein
MPYIPSKTFVAGEQLDAADLQGNLDGLKIYSQQTDTGGYITGQLIEAQHIVRPFVDPVSNALDCVSGFYCSQTSTGLFGSGSFMSRFEADEGQKMVIPQTSLVIPAVRACTIFYQFWAAAEARRDGSSTKGIVYLNTYLGTVDSWNPAEQNKFYEQANNEPLSVSGRRFINCYRTVDLSAGQQYHIGLSGYGGANGQLVNWGFTIEVFYL